LNIQPNSSGMPRRIIPAPMEFDRLVKTAGNILAARHICAALGIKPEEEAHHRFGFAA
jgi:hypothetical protein